jgi:hypothetical protein
LALAVLVKAGYAHDVRLAACALVAVCSLVAGPAVASAATPKPKTGRSVVVKRTGGTVLYVKKGSRRAQRLGSQAVSLPVGSAVDTTNGKVKLTSTHNKSGSKLQSATFYDGAFTVSQDKSSSPLTELDLAGGDFGPCQQAKRQVGVFKVNAAASARRRLWGRGKGRFRTRGRNGTATVRGTQWLTEDLCEGTMTTTRSGVVATNSTELDLERSLKPGQSVIYYCNTDGVPGLSSLYCVLVLSQPADNLFGFGIATAGTPDDQYQLCIQEPDGQVGCDNFPFGPEEDGIKAGGVGCFPRQQGSHIAAWGIEGQILPIPLPFESSQGGDALCVSSPPRPGIDPPARLSKSQLRKARAAAGGG